jgi:DnaK suppressor protein
MTPKASAQAGLTESQLARLHTLLEKKRSELTARLQSVRDRVGGVHERLADPVDRASESEEDAEELGVADPDDRILGQVERALSKLEQGTYGLSEVSGEPIGFDRLEALPWATQTAQEKQAREKRSR